MNTRILEFDSLIEGCLIKRYKRFLADILLDDGTQIVAHCPNTGPMKGLIDKDCRVRVSYSPSPSRKLSWTWQQVQVRNYKNKNIWVGVNTLIANKLIKSAIEKNLLQKTIGEFHSIRTEVTYGVDKKSRIDLLIRPKSSNPDNRDIYIEVKNTTWVNRNIALFPDTVTLRGQKHLKELSHIIPNAKGILIPCIARSDTEYFSTGDDADPFYGELFRKSVSQGLIVLPCTFSFFKDHIRWNGNIQLLNNL